MNFGELLQSKSYYSSPLRACFRIAFEHPSRQSSACSLPLGLQSCRRRTGIEGLTQTSVHSFKLWLYIGYSGMLTGLLKGVWWQWKIFPLQKVIGFPWDLNGIIINVCCTAVPCEEVCLGWNFGVQSLEECVWINIQGVCPIPMMIVIY